MMKTTSSPDAPAMASDKAGHEFWRGVLLAGGCTAIPRWTKHPVPGVGQHEVEVPEGCMSSLRGLAGAMSVPLTSVLLTGHARVLAALSGESEVCTGYAREAGDPLPCRIVLTDGTWRELLLECVRVHSELLVHRNFPVDDLRRQMGLTDPQFETVFELHGDSGGELTESTVLRVAFITHDHTMLRLRYRTDVLDADAAARIAGYHLAALSLIAADPDAQYTHQTLLSADEQRFQVHRLAGRRKVRPDRRAHELFEAQALAHPNAVAASHGVTQMTYQALNARANQLARALIARGLTPESVVAVATERNLDWTAAVLAIFKAGGAYLPIEPHFPADRIARMLSRAGCRLVLTESGSSAMLDGALEIVPGVESLFIEAALGESHASEDLEIAVGRGALAYIYFTSGSTGEPKGAMCEHAGMLNHLFAKIDDFKIGAGDVVAQTAPQCFDISLWQLMSALMVGGRTLVVEQDTILDAQRFIDRIAQERVAVIQVVPSYLDVLVAFLEEHPRALPNLRFVSATGEALKAELVERWFAVQPDIKLVNAYGLTETSDDTNHEIMVRAPRDGRISLGRPISNVHVSVVDGELVPVPLGAPGEIVFSGVCVGRGYINDPERTQRSFLSDPARKGERIYRSGDYGRWRPDGKLEFLGRRDAQVKISGFRIEIGEVENGLLRLDGVRDGAVVVTERDDGSKQLVAFYTADEPLEPATMCDQMAASLPAYMIPSIYHWREALPVTPNGKIDKKGLAALAWQLDAVPAQRDQPRTATEQKLAEAWAAVLGIQPQQIGRHDHFFDLGGTSLSALRLAIALGRTLSFKDLAEHPVLAEQASALDRLGARAAPESVPQGSCAT